MILHSYSEEKILEELLSNYQIMAKEAKKLAKKEVQRQMKLGHEGIDEDISILRDYTTSVLHNKWQLVVVINMSRKVKWYHQSVCYVESNIHTKDYYIVRGFSNNKPYFIKISSHVLKRCRERLFGERLNVDTQNLDAGFLVTVVIRKGEVIPWMKIADPRLLKAVLNSEDMHSFNTLFYTTGGCYLGSFTENGNVIFNTFLNNDNDLKKPEENVALYMCKLAHIGFNQKLYPKKVYNDFLNSDEKIPDIIGEILMDYKDKYKLLP